MDPRIQQALHRMEKDCDQKLSLSQLAHSYNLSSSRFSHLFKAQTGLSPYEYLKSLRMQRARELLESTWLTVNQITAKVGLMDQSHFVRDFKKSHGLSPTQYRVRHFEEKPITNDAEWENQQIARFANK